MIIIFHQGFCFTSCYKPFLEILSLFAPTTCLYHHILLLSIYIFISCFVHIHQLWCVHTVQSIVHILCKFHNSKLVRKKIWVRSQSISQYMVQPVSRLSLCSHNSNNSCLLISVFLFQVISLKLYTVGQVTVSHLRYFTKCIVWNWSHDLAWMMDISLNVLRLIDILPSGKRNKSANA